MRYVKTALAGELVRPSELNGKWVYLGDNVWARPAQGVPTGDLYDDIQQALNRRQKPSWVKKNRR